MGRRLEDGEPDEDFFAGIDKQSISVPRVGLVDCEAVAWAVGKLKFFRLHEAGSDHKKMLERLQKMLTP